ncbi:hypothetical protein CMV_009233 [Castanea mollissima]|uniref:Uncharacterized protein n=1 Tax=Castanea mollissima TaxID=60419 RepID=A0A8J4RA69_9ROSI|nr:hypothetical protein CMV_009233 [Castanea mollissima]
MSVESVRWSRLVSKFIKAKAQPSRRCIVVLISSLATQEQSRRPTYRLQEVGLTSRNNLVCVTGGLHKPEEIVIKEVPSEFIKKTNRKKVKS